MKTQIALDVDGVLANFYLAMCRRFNRPYKPISKWNVGWLGNHFDEIKNDFEFWSTLPTLTPPEEINFEVTAYVSSLPEIMEEARRAWLKANNYPSAPLFVSGQSKVSILKELGITHYVDDKTANVEEIREAGISCFRFIPPYMFEPTSGKLNYDIKNLNEINLLL